VDTGRNPWPQQATAESGERAWARGQSKQHFNKQDDVIENFSGQRIHSTSFIFMNERTNETTIFFGGYPRADSYAQAWINDF
jgi:hypothetical protein